MQFDLSKEKLSFEYGLTLKSFKNYQKAFKELTKEHEKAKKDLDKLCANANVFKNDYSLESIKLLEDRYFSLCKNQGFKALKISKERFEELMFYYVCESAVNSTSDCKWCAKEYKIMPHRYEFGICRGFIHYFKKPKDYERSQKYTLYNEITEFCSRVVGTDFDFILD